MASYRVFGQSQSIHPDSFIEWIRSESGRRNLLIETGRVIVTRYFVPNTSSRQRSITRIYIYILNTSRPQVYAAYKIYELLHSENTQQNSNIWKIFTAANNDFTDLHAVFQRLSFFRIFWYKLTKEISKLRINFILSRYNFHWRQRNPFTLLYA